MSAFDTVQVSWTFKHNETIKNCIVNCTTCSSEIYEVLQGFDTMPKAKEGLSRPVDVAEVYRMRDIDGGGIVHLVRDDVIGRDIDMRDIDAGGQSELAVAPCTLGGHYKILPI
nr:pectin acetylesterase 8-like [Ipomoea trifida]